MAKVVDFKIEEFSALIDNISDIKQLNSIAALLGIEQATRSGDKTAEKVIAAQLQVVQNRGRQMCTFNNIIDTQARDSMVMQLEERLTIDKDHMSKFLETTMAKQEVRPALSHAIFLNLTKHVINKENALSRHGSFSSAVVDSMPTQSKAISSLLNTLQQIINNPDVLTCVNGSLKPQKSGRS